MKPIAALTVATLSAVATFTLQGTNQPARAASFRIQDGPNWREEMLDGDTGKAGIDHRIAMMTEHLQLSSEQAVKARTILQREHDRVEALLLTAPVSFTRAQFLVEGRRIHAETRQQIHALLTPDQVEIADEMHPGAAVTAPAT